MNKKKYQKPKVDVYPMKRPSLFQGTTCPAAADEPGA